MLDFTLRCKKRNPQAAYLAPTYSQAKRVAWQYIKDYTKSIPGVKVNESELKITIEREDDRITFFLLGAENPDSLTGIYLDYVILDEYAMCNPSVWTTVLRPALSDRKGSATFISTPRGSNSFHKMYLYAREQMKKGDASDWFAAIYKASQTGIIPRSELEAARATMSEEEYLQEFECDFSVANIGAYYKSQFTLIDKQKRVTSVPHESGFPVDISFDLGIDDSSAIWFIQTIGRERRAIDYLEVSGKGLDDIVKLVLAKGYLLRYAYLPHDIKVRELSSGRTRLDTLRNLNLLSKRNNYIVVPKHRVEDGINQVRMMLSTFWFDEHNCIYGVECLKAYERIFDSKEGVFKGKPRHNYASHAADSFRYFAMGHFSEQEIDGRDDLPDSLETEYDIFGGM
jgi:hypothetical protein